MQKKIIHRLSWCIFSHFVAVQS